MSAAAYQQTYADARQCQHECLLLCTVLATASCDVLQLRQLHSKCPRDAPPCPLPLSLLLSLHAAAIYFWGVSFSTVQDVEIDTTK
jgi:hypothetical protein